MAVVQLCKGLIAPLYDDLASLALVALVYQDFHKLRLIQTCVDNYSLPLLDINAHPGDQLGILPKYSLFHGKNLQI